MEKQNKIKILLVDDDEMIRIYFRDIFWVHGGDSKYDVNMASSIKEAEKIIEDETKRPDTIFLDMLMPVPDEDNSPDAQIKRTLSFIEKIKKDKDLSKIRIIIHSSQKETFIKEEVCKLGVDGYLVKGELMPKEIIDFTNKIHEPNN
jgi:DNA-binding NarL/FixJ family response regulator